MCHLPQREQKSSEGKEGPQHPQDSEDRDDVALDAAALHRQVILAILIICGVPRTYSYHSIHDVHLDNFYYEFTLVSSA